MKIRQRVLAVLVAVFVFFCSCFSVGAVTYDELDTGYQAIWDAYVSYMSSVFKGCPSEAIRNLVKLDSTIIATELEGVKALLFKNSNVYYYLDGDGNLQVDDSHSTHGGGAGRRRVSSGDDIYVEAPVFKDIVVASNNFYFPSGKELKVLSYQNNTISVEKNRYSHCLLNGSSLGVLPSGSTTDIYLLPFQILGGKYYFNTNQLHISLVDGVIQPVVSLSCYDSTVIINTSDYNNNCSISSYPYMSIKYMYRDTVDYYYRIYSNGEDYVKNQNFREGWIYRSAFRAYDDTDASSSIHASFMEAPDWSTDDVGYYVSDSFINMNGCFTDVDPTLIPSDTYITLSGDTFYDYSITNKAGNTTTINNYITNNYNYPSSDNSSGGGSSGGGTTSGDVNVGGNVNVSGNIDVGGSVDVNINVNSGGGADINDYIDVDPVETNVDEILAAVPSVSKGFIDYLTGFFAWLPKEIYGLLVLGLVVAVWCRLMGR